MKARELLVIAQANRIVMDHAHRLIARRATQLVMESKRGNWR